LIKHLIGDVAINLALIEERADFAFSNADAVEVTCELAVELQPAVKALLVAIFRFLPARGAVAKRSGEPR
jgi:hypothetical protein